MSVAVRTVSGRLDDADRQRAVYGGELLIFKDVEQMAALCSYLDELHREVLAPADPTRAQFELGRDEYPQRLAELRRRFRGDPAAKALLRSVLEGVGVEPGRSAWDRPHLRVSPHSDEHDHDGIHTLGFHRDTWASNVYSQTNWWAPIYPVTAGRTIAFYPQYWAEPLANTSADWDLHEVMAGRMTEITPTPTVPVQTASELRIVIEPGDVLCFSGAQLHASIPNGTGLGRFSVEVRTADIADEAARQGTPNIDGAAPHVALRWFRRIADDQPLADVLGRDRADQATVVGGS